MLMMLYTNNNRECSVPFGIAHTQIERPPMSQFFEENASSRKSNIQRIYACDGRPFSHEIYFQLHFGVIKRFVIV